MAATGGSIGCTALHGVGNGSAGAMRGAMAGADGTDEETAKAFAIKVLDQVIGGGASWAASGFSRPTCPSCGEGFDSESSHFAVCPAAGRLEMLRPHDEVKVVGVEKMPQLNGKVCRLQDFVKERQRWKLRVNEKEMLFKAANLQKVS
eukprot:symbB.v1.2.015547.t1/scaffold1164.1/size134582/2